MTDKPQKPDLSDHEEEETPFDDVMRKLLAAKPAIKPAPETSAPKAKSKPD